MRNDRRQFNIYDLEIGARKKGAKIPTLRELVPVFHDMKTSRRIYPIRNDTGEMLLADIRIETSGDILALLVRLSDKTSPNAVYSDIKADKFNEMVKGANEGGDFCCHVLVSLEPEKRQPNVYTCAIERVSGLSADLVQRLLSKFLHFRFDEDAAFYCYPHPGGGLDRNNQPRRDRCLPHIDLRGRPSQSLIDDINGGRLTGITLVKAEEVAPIDGAAYLRKSSSELKLSIDPKSYPEQIWNSVKDTLRKLSPTYGQARLAYKNASGTKTVSVVVDAKTAEPLTQQFLLSFEVRDLFPHLPQSSKSFVEHLLSKAIPIFVTHRNI